MTTISAHDNPDLVNELIAKATSPEQSGPQKVTTLAPWDNNVALPGGYITPAGDVLTGAVVRELTGRDEETIGRANTPGRQFLTILSCGLVSVGGEPATEEILDDMLVGDRDMVMLGIYKATFGPEVPVAAACDTCGDVTEVTVEIDSIPVKRLDNPLDREFVIEGRKSIRCYLPTGRTQKGIMLDPNRSEAKLTTEVLQNSVVEINGSPVFSKEQVLELGVADRRKVSEALVNRSPGPQLNDAEGTCTVCSSTVKVAVNLGAMFRF